MNEAPVAQAPIGWTRASLRETAQPGRDGFFDGDWIEAPYITEAGIRLIQTGNVGLGEYLDKPSNARFISEKTFKALGCSWVYPGDLLICRLADPVGRACIVPEDVGKSVTSVDCAVYRPDPNKVSVRYMLHLLNAASSLLAVQEVTGGSTRQRVSRSALGTLLYLLPPLAEQRGVARVLDALDEQIRITDCIVAKLKMTQIGLRHDLLLGRGSGNRPSHQSRFGPLPTGWESRSIGELTDYVGSGVTPRGGSEVYQSEGVLFIRSQNVHFDGLRLADAVFIAERVHESMSRSKVRENDVLLNITGASIGRCCRMPPGLGEANVNQHVCLIRLKEPSQSDAEYLSSFLASPFGQHQVTILNAGGNREGLNYEQVRSFEVIWPPADDRARIAESLGAADLEIAGEIERARKLRVLKRGLMSDLLSGGVRVPVDTSV